MMPEAHISIPKTARYAYSGNRETPDEVWIVLHGYGQLAPYFLRKFDAFNHPQRLIIAPEGLHRFYLKGMNGRVGASWMTKEARETDIADYLQWLDRLALQFEKPIQQAKKLLLLGFSQGAATAARWACHSSLDFTDVVLWAAGFPPDLQLPQHEKPSNWHVCMGAEDQLLKNNAQLTADFAAEKIQTFSYKGGHEIPKNALDEWLQKQHYMGEK
jgi:predicted esterase